MSPRTESLLRQSSKYLSATAVSRIVGFVAVPILVSRLSTVEYGKLGLLQSIVPVAAPLVTLGVVSTICVAYNDRREWPHGTMLQTALTYGLISSLVLVPLLGVGVNAAFGALDSMMVLSACVLIMASIWATLLDGYQRAAQRAGLVSASRVAREAGFLLFVLFVALLGKLDIRTVLVCYILAEMCRVFMLSRPLRPLIGQLSFRSLAGAPALLAFSLPLVSHVFATATLHYADRWVIGAVRGAAEVGVYTLAYQIAGVAGSIYAAQNEAVSASLLSQHSRHGLAGLQEAHRRTAWWYILVAAAGGVLVWLAGSVYLGFLAPAPYRAGIVPLGIILLGFVFQAAYLPFVNILFALKASRSLAVFSAAAAILNVVACLVLVPIAGINGAAVATLLSYALLAATVGHKARQLAGVGLSYGDLQYTLRDARLRVTALVARLRSR